MTILRLQYCSLMLGLTAVFLLLGNRSAHADDLLVTRSSDLAQLSADALTGPTPTVPTPGTVATSAASLQTSILTAQATPDTTPGVTPATMPATIQPTPTTLNNTLPSSGETTPNTLQPTRAATPGTMQPSSETTPGTLQTAPPPETTPGAVPSVPSAVPMPMVTPGRATRSGPSYVGVGVNIGFGGSSDLGRGSFSAFSKIGLTNNLSFRPAININRDPAILLPITVDFPIRSVGNDRVSFAPYVGGGVVISTGSDSIVRALITGGVDVPVTEKFTANASVNVGFFGNTEVGLRLGVGYNF